VSTPSWLRASDLLLEELIPAFSSATSVSVPIITLVRIRHHGSQSQCFAHQFALRRPHHVRCNHMLRQSSSRTSSWGMNRARSSVTGSPCSCMAFTMRPSLLPAHLDPSLRLQRKWSPKQHLLSANLRVDRCILQDTALPLLCSLSCSLCGLTPSPLSRSTMLSCRTPRLLFMRLDASPRPFNRFER
jgi:hypothetical protein